MITREMLVVFLTDRHSYMGMLIGFLVMLFVHLDYRANQRMEDMVRKQKMDDIIWHWEDYHQRVKTQNRDKSLRELRSWVSKRDFDSIQ